MSLSNMWKTDKIITKNTIFLEGPTPKNSVTPISGRKERKKLPPVSVLHLNRPEGLTFTLELREGTLCFAHSGQIFKKFD